MGKRKKKAKFSKFEKLLYTIAVILIVVAPVSVVFSKAQWLFFMDNWRLWGWKNESSITTIGCVS